MCVCMCNDIVEREIGLFDLILFSQEAAEAARQDYFYCSRGKMHFNINKHCFNVSSPEWSIKLCITLNIARCYLKRSRTARENEKYYL